MDLKQGAKALNKLEENASKLSELIPRLNEVNSTLKSLKESDAAAQKNLKLYEENLSKIEGQLTDSIQLKLAEGLAEVSSRTKDLYDFSLTNKAKVESELGALKSVSNKQSNALKNLEEGLAEVSSRTKDLYDFSLTNKEKVESELGVLKSASNEQNNALKNMEAQLSDFSKLQDDMLMKIKKLRLLIIFFGLGLPAVAILGYMLI